jgi:GTP-binding protein HflX
VDVIIFDDEISPSQQRNLERLFKKTVMDRTEVILGVFADRAQTKEAQLQIELAKVSYDMPRLKRMWTHLSRQAGSVGGAGAYLKGEGEKQIEIDKRLLQRRYDRLVEELELVKESRRTQRQKRLRSEIPTFAIIGYTNAGKSTLLNSLTDAKVFVEDKLFATLDTTTRQYTLPNNQDVLLIDTVGFIRKLPHLLVAAFKSTLEESLEADILLNLVDVSDHQADLHAATTYEVLKELNVKDKPIITLLNKVDVCQDPMMIQKLKIQYPKNVTISALTKEGFDELFDLMVKEISHIRTSLVLRIPQSRYDLVADVIKYGRIQRQDYEENDVILYVELPKIMAARLKKYAI